MSGRIGGAEIGRRARVVVAAVFLLASPVVARPGIDESLTRVKELVARLGAEPAPPPSERAALLDESIQVRGDLIATAGRDERAASWMLDQAEALLQRAGWDGAEWSVLYGVATGAQRARVGEAAAMAATLIDRARGAIEETVERLEAELFAARGNAADAGRISAVIEPRLSVLLDVEQAWRVPMLAARTELLVIASEDGAVRPMERRAQAAGIAAQLDGLPTPDDAGDAARLVQLGTAYLLAGENAAAGDRFHAAEDVAGASDSAREQARLGRVAAAMNLSAARELSKGLLTSQDSTPLLLALVRAEVAARAVLLQAPASGAARVSVQRDAMTGLAAVIRRVIREGSGVASSARELSMQKVAAVTGPGRAWGPVEAAAMEPAIVYARGMTMLASEEGRGLLRHVVTGDGPADVREAAMWALGTRAPEGDDARFEAASMLMRLVREFPASDHATPARARADALLRGLMGSRRAEVLALQRELIELSSGDDASSEARAELGSLAAANLALDENSRLDAPALARMLERLPSWPESEAQRRAADQRNVSIVVERALHGAETAAARAAIARVGAAWAAQTGSDLTARFRLALAEGLLASGDAKGSVEAVNAIGGLDAAALSDAERIRARMTLGRAQRASGDEGAAFATLRGLADELDVEGSGRAGRDPAFWAAWAEMLEILRTQNGDGARSSTIRLQVNRLKLIDAALGGEPWRERILKVEASLE